MSISFTLSDATDWTGGKLSSGSGTSKFEAVGIDTRTLETGSLFVAIRGDQYDAHNFIPQALAAGAGGLMVESGWLRENAPAPGIPILSVENTTLALGDLARGHRERWAGPVVAVTGSNGKTSTKEMIHGILSARGPCLKNRGNLNNEFGLPLTLLAREKEHAAAVVELGMNHRGEIARLAAIARPDVGVITNVASAHIEFFQDQAEIALEKGDLVAALEPSGIAVLNRDDALVFAQANRVEGRVTTFGLRPEADVTAEDVVFEDGGSFSFLLRSPAGHAPIHVRGLSETTILNALAAATACLALEVQLEDIQRGLADFEGVAGRMTARTIGSGGHVIDDTYNANPQSFRHALESLARLKGRGLGIAVIGDMGELGKRSDQAHDEIGQLVAKLGIDLIFVIGDHSQRVADAAAAAGMDPKNIRLETDLEVLAQEVTPLVGADDWVLVKGSRSMRMEKVVASLTSEEFK